MSTPGEQWLTVVVMSLPLLALVETARTTATSVACAPDPSSYRAEQHTSCYASTLATACCEVLLFILNSSFQHW
jgi:hypothetical protein